MVESEYDIGALYCRNFVSIVDFNMKGGEEMKVNGSADVSRYGLYNLPSRLFKYYPYDNKLNEKRLTGEVYLASPLDFNDPCDCQRGVTNNIQQLGKDLDWVKLKMIELGYGGKMKDEVALSLMNGNESVEEVYNRQLQKMGILCTTESYSNSLMWGYYTNNEGFCVEYDTDKLVKALVVGFVNELDYELTRFLFENKQYKNPPEKRSSATHPEQCCRVEQFAFPDCVEAIENNYLKEKSDVEKSNFLTNIFLKRFFGDKITYCAAKELANCQPTLFFDKDNKESKSKYFLKTKSWNHEEEFRITVSLGGRKVIKLNKDIIKNVFIGCNVPNEKIVEIACILAASEVNCGLHVMQRGSKCNLHSRKLDIFSLNKNLVQLMNYIKTARK